MIILKFVEQRFLTYLDLLSTLKIFFLFPQNRLLYFDIVGGNDSLRIISKSYKLERENKCIKFV